MLTVRDLKVKNWNDFARLLHSLYSVFSKETVEALFNVEKVTTHYTLWYSDGYTDEKLTSDIPASKEEKLTKLCKSINKLLCGTPNDGLWLEEHVKVVYSLTEAFLDKPLKELLVENWSDPREAYRVLSAHVDTEQLLVILGRKVNKIPRIVYEEVITWEYSQDL